MNDKIKSLSFSAMLAALVFAATLISIPLPTGGYANAGDAILIAGTLLINSYACSVGAGIGAAIADLTLGFAAYAPVTFIIKALMSLTVHVFPKKGFLVNLISAAVAECIMCGGYFVYEIFLYGIPGAVADIPGNLVQGAFGVTLGLLLYQILKKTVKIF